MQPALQGNILCIADEDENKRGRGILGIPIVGIEALNAYERGIPVLITPERGTQEITRTLTGLGFESLYYYNGESCHSAAAVASQPAADPAMYDAAKIAVVERLLNDDKSKAVFYAKLDSWFKCEHIAVEKLFECDQYFPSGIIRLGKKEVFADCGAMDGGTILDFARRAGCWEYIYGFEPVSASYELCRSVLASHRIVNARIEPFAVSARWGTATVMLSNNNIGAHRISDYEAVFQDDFPYGDNSAGETVEVRSLDEMELEHIPTFIKMDIEGGELDALKGASGTIRAHRPKLAISVYHHPAHLYEIPLLINELCQDYQIYFRQHSLYFETVCYAVC
jgi:FkbM family methyltransferase